MENADPGSSRAALSSAILPERTLNTQLFCAACGRDRINTVLMPPHSQHHAALRCGECDFFRGWASKPETTQRRLEQQQAIAQLLESSAISDWERGFLESIRNQKKLSPRQHERLSRIAAKGGQC